jgi:hypothetical protein
MLGIVGSVVAVVLYIVGCVTNVLIADAKGLSGGGAFLASLFLSPVVVWAYLVAVPPKRPVVTIPYCSRMLNGDNDLRDSVTK